MNKINYLKITKLIESYIKFLKLKQQILVSNEMKNFRDIMSKLPSTAELLADVLATQKLLQSRTDLIDKLLKS